MYLTCQIHSSTVESLIDFCGHECKILLRAQMYSLVPPLCSTSIQCCIGKTQQWWHIYSIALDVIIMSRFEKYSHVFRFGKIPRRQSLKSNIDWTASSSEWIDSIFSQGSGQNTQSSISTQNGKSDRVHLVFLRHAKSGRKEKKRVFLKFLEIQERNPFVLLMVKKYVLRNTSRVVPELKFNFEVTCVTHHWFKMVHFFMFF